jgi:hypothetical protein
VALNNIGKGGGIMHAALPPAQFGLVVRLGQGYALAKGDRYVPFLTNHHHQPPATQPFKALPWNLKGLFLVCNHRFEVSTHTKYF